MDIFPFLLVYCEVLQEPLLLLSNISKPVFYRKKKRLNEEGKLAIFNAMQISLFKY